MAMAIGAGTVDMSSVQVHPTGLVHEKEPDAKVGRCRLTPLNQR